MSTEVPADNNPRAAADRSLTARQAKARIRFLDLWSVIAAIGLLGGIVWLMGILSVPVAILIWTLIIVFCLRGIVNGLERVHVNRAIGTTVAYVVMALVIAVVGFLLFSPMFGLNAQFNDLLTSMPHYVDAVIAWGNDIYVRYAPVFEDDTVKSLIAEAQKAAASWAAGIAQGSANGVVAFGTTLANGLMAFGFGLVIAFWVLMELPAIGRETRRLIGPKHAGDAEFFHATFTRVMGGYIKGTLFQCAIIGVGCGVLFGFIGVPNAAVLGLITGVMNIIPIIGPWIGGALAAIVAIFSGPMTAAIALIGTIVIQQLVYTFISPKIMANSVDIHPALTLFALMVGSALGGAMSGLLGSLVGMLASIPLVAVAKSVFVYYFEKRTGRHLVAEDGVFFKGTPANAEEVNPIADATAPGTTGTLRPIRLENMPGISGRLPKLHMQRHGRITPRHSHDEDDGRR
ncbi:AI-2E family transporter [Adlercreutzia muris]|uniref:AI-2E family transporter n=1 Tax=Adlercreutzia muris TaxID=1796610 RepID=A0A7C8FPM1_9ACTN|nr:AI-2E family transporter [Adlercreutzia muris]KAB1650852.1 AI-2E family transporter [Adlercreutzia muris]MCR2028081.1 AI-2E family transporter [Adlercreutzia muris]MCU7584934.1 AI-2E family transporter [Adlercreutzia muris]